MSKVPQRLKNQYTQQEWNEVLELVKNNRSEFIREFQKSLLTIDKHRDDLLLLPTKEDRVKRIRELIRRDR